QQRCEEVDLFGLRLIHALVEGVTEIDLHEHVEIARVAVDAGGDDREGVGVVEAVDRIEVGAAGGDEFDFGVIDRGLNQQVHIGGVVENGAELEQDRLQQGPAVCAVNRI